MSMKGQKERLKGFRTKRTKRSPFAGNNAFQALEGKYKVEDYHTACTQYVAKVCCLSAAYKRRPEA